ncbi:hypothetical protein TNCV_634701 [Trichonephila clavipes]|nr:hypothetical protein TNCV_634701 [Trichonephila clavipes]
MMKNIVGETRGQIFSELEESDFTDKSLENQSVATPLQHYLLENQNAS